MKKVMDSSKPRKVVLRSTSALSLNERFSQVLANRLTQSSRVNFDTHTLHQRWPSHSPSVVLLVKKEPLPVTGQQDRVSGWVAGVSPRVKRHWRRRKTSTRSVWTRLGCQQVSHCLSTPKRRGFWSFRNKYKWRARFTSVYRGQNPRLHLQRSGATPSKGKVQNKQEVPTRKQLDAQLDEYMSLSKSRLDQQLDEYMSLSKQHLDAELDEFMSLAGQSELLWD